VGRAVTAAPGEPRRPRPTPPDSPIPIDACAYCGTRRTVGTWSRWGRVLIPIGIGLLASGLGAGAASLARDTATRERVAILDERRLETSDDRQRLGAAQIETERELVRVRLEIAEQLRQISTSLARIEVRLDAAERPRRRDDQ